MSSTAATWSMAEKSSLIHAAVLKPGGEDDQSILLRELHHRLFNNFQHIASLVRNTRCSINDASVAVEKIDDLENRLFAFADLNRLLSRSCPAECLDSHCRTICNKLFKAFGRQDAKACVRIANVELSSSQSLRIALLVAELVTNIMKHGLQRRTTTVSIELRATYAGLLELKVCDDSVAMVSCNSRPTIVDALAKSLGGAALVETGSGYVTRVLFGAEEL
jgi:two-component system, sensor histidine kinase PdtaS